MTQERPPGPGAPLKSEAQSATGAADKESQLFFRALRRLRAELQDLQKILRQISTGQACLEYYADYIERTFNDIDQIVKDDIRSKEEVLVPRYADNVRRILNLWEQMQLNSLLSHPHTKPDAQNQTCQLNILEGQFKDLIFEIGFLTVPDRLNRWLDQTDTGHYVPFHDVFEDEIPDYGDRVKLLNYLAWAPKTVRSHFGLVEPDTGLVYRYGKDEERKRRKIELGFILVVATAIVAALAYIPLEGWPLGPKDLPGLLVGWAAVIIGVIVHIGIDTAKRQQQKSRPPVIAVGDLWLLVSAKFGQVMLKILLTLVGFLGLVFAAGIENAKPLNAFLVGYSLDSFVGLLSTSIEQRGATQLATLRQQLGVTDKS